MSKVRKSEAVEVDLDVMEKLQARQADLAQCSKELEEAEGAFREALLDGDQVKVRAARRRRDELRLCVEDIEAMIEALGPRVAAYRSHVAEVDRLKSVETLRELCLARGQAAADVDRALSALVSAVTRWADLRAGVHRAWQSARPRRPNDNPIVNAGLPNGPLSDREYIREALEAALPGYGLGDQWLGRGAYSLAEQDKVAMVAEREFPSGGE